MMAGGPLYVSEPNNSQTLSIKNFGATDEKNSYVSFQLGPILENAYATDELNVSFGCQFTSLDSNNDEVGHDCTAECEHALKISRSSSFSSLRAAAVSANFTLANTSICNGRIREEILPELDSPNSFKKITSSPSMSKLDMFSSSPLQSSSSPEKSLLQPNLDFPPSEIELLDFNGGMGIQVAGGAAGEDRIQAVCSEKDGWVFCGIYDGFNGRDAADFLAVKLYDNFAFYLSHLKQQIPPTCSSEGDQCSSSSSTQSGLTLMMKRAESADLESALESSETFQTGVLGCLVQAVQQAEKDFLSIVMANMDERPDLVSVGSCVLVALLHGMNLYILNLGDSRAILASGGVPENGTIRATQLTETHTVDNELEYEKLVASHPGEPTVVIGKKIKGKLKVTRALGVGYLKEAKFNDVLMGILRVQNLQTPPYIDTNVHTLCHRVSEDDHFVVLSSDGLFDFFTNDEVVAVVYKYIRDNPSGDPARYLIGQLLHRAAKKAGMTVKELVQIPDGSRRKYHDDITIIVIMLGHQQKTLSASTQMPSV